MSVLPLHRSSTPEPVSTPSLPPSRSPTKSLPLYITPLLPPFFLSPSLLTAADPYSLSRLPHLAFLQWADHAAHCPGHRRNRPQCTPCPCNRLWRALLVSSVLDPPKLIAPDFYPPPRVAQSLGASTLKTRHGSPSNPSTIPSSTRTLPPNFSYIAKPR